MDLRFIFLWLLITMKTVLSLDKDMSCAVCRALIDEVNYSISKVNPKKKIQVGSFRVDSKGNQGTYEKPYARSEIHLLEIFEEVCESFSHYAETTNSAGKKSVARTQARDGKTLSLSNIKIGAETGKQLKHRCESLLEEYEDDMIAVFGKEDVPDVESLLCVETTSQCTDEDIKVPMPITEVDENEPENTEEEDEELLEMYQEDNADNLDTMPADTVIEPKIQADTSSDASDQQKEEL